MIKEKVLIIGAGIAGLAAASYLKAQGVNAVILEARERVGGRICTDYSWGLALDLGATWLAGIEGNPMAELAQKYQLSWELTDLSLGYVVNESRLPLSREQLIQSEKEFDAILGAAHQSACQRPHDISLAQALVDSSSQIQRFGGGSSLYAWRLALASSYMGAGAQELSGRHWAEEEYLSGGSNLLLSGFQRIVEGLAHTAEVLLNVVVQQIHWDKAGVKVHTNQGVWEADKVIITLPLGILKSEKVQFFPALPELKRQTIMRLGMGVLNKIALRFPRAFWPEEYQYFSYTADAYELVPIFMNYHYYFKQPVLLGYTTGDLARNLELLDDATLTDVAITSLQKIFGTNIPKPEAILATRWAQDPFALGSYSYIAVDSSGEDYDQLAVPIANKLYFAGEATSRRFPGNSHGAYLSGIRAAKEILAL